MRLVAALVCTCCSSGAPMKRTLSMSRSAELDQSVLSTMSMLETLRCVCLLCGVALSGRAEGQTVQRHSEVCDWHSSTSVHLSECASMCLHCQFIHAQYHSHCLSFATLSWFLMLLTYEHCQSEFTALLTTVTYQPMQLFMFVSCCHCLRCIAP